MKKLVVFYSYEGSTKLLAESIADAAGADMLELTPRKESNVRGFVKYFWLGKDVFFQKKPELLDFDRQPEDYDVIFIGTPVWAFTYTPAIRTFLEKQNIKGKRIALFCSYDGTKGKTIENMKKKLANNEIVGEKDFFRVRKNREKSISEAKKWAKEVLMKC